VLKKSGISYDQNFLIFSCFFLAGGLLNVKVFYKVNELKRLLKISFITKLLAITVFFGVLTVFIGDYYKLKPSLIDFISKHGVMFPVFSWGSFISKTCDIFYQQLMLWTILSRFIEANVNMGKTILWVTALFALLHLPLLYFFKWFGLVFVVPSLIAGGIFSFFILRGRAGILISVIVHQLFYLISGILMRVF
jgi:hypothetical protein